MYLVLTEGWIEIQVETFIYKYLFPQTANLLLFYDYYLENFPFTHSCPDRGFSFPL